MTAFALRAPWYQRERDGLGLRDPAALRPTLQMYDDTDFVRRIVADPRDSIAFGDDDVWSYPVPVTPSGNGRARLATWQLVPTGLRKLYQPSHNRFYAVAVEVFCDQPGLPRAGSHSEIEVGFVVRRQLTSVTGARGPSRRVARALMKELAQQEKLALDESVTGLRDVRDLWWADQARRRRFAQDHAEQLGQLQVDTEEQGWFTGPDGTAGWRPVDDVDADLQEETFPMWRLPARPDDCSPARTRSTWFGLVPTYSSDHSVGEKETRPKYDDRAIYEIRCFVRLKPARGKEHCPPRIWWSEAASEPFRIADPMDPEGTSKRLTSITLPDLRRLAARAGRPMGPGGVAITTPPRSQLVFNPFDPTKGAIGNGGSICTFAIELFFLVAFFLFLMFLPIVVFLFQLWFLLALRFCIPPSLGLSITADFFAQGKVLADFEADVDVNADLSGLVPPLTPAQAIDQIFGTDSTTPGVDPGAWLTELLDAQDDAGNSVFAEDADLMHAVVTGTDPDTAVEPAPQALDSLPDDPLCPRSN